jgi:hypothetical protein
MPGSESWILSRISHIYLSNSHMFSIYSCCLELLFIYHWNGEHISWQNLSWKTDCRPVDRQVLKPAASLSFLQKCQPVKWMFRQIW